MHAWPILTVAMDHETDIIAVRQCARRTAELLGFEAQDQTRIATAVSEIARDALAATGRGIAEFLLDGGQGGQSLRVRIVDQGGLEHEGSGTADAPGTGPEAGPGNGPGNGIVWATRLMDSFSADSVPGVGTTVVMEKQLPKRTTPITAGRLHDIARLLVQDAAADPLVVIREQSRALVDSLQQLQLRQDEGARLNEELERTNQGVVALYAELDRRAAELQELNASLEARVAASIAERKRVEDNLRQSQKMEAVGQLTGGIAHDFNNMLTGIIGSLEMLRRRLAVRRFDDVDRFMDAATTSAQRAAGLTHRLLAFSRRQSLDPRPIDVNALATGMEELVRRTLGESICLRLELESDLWPVEADSNQLESALLNLAINARDAMPGGGTLTVATGRALLDQAYTEGKSGLEPGEFVVLAVSDTGQGMSPTVMERAFEPFFTTKPVGAGSGLGLSMVYGFVKQSRGHVDIASRLGSGTTVKLLLPRAQGGTASDPQDAACEPQRALAGEVVLVVEDEPAVRMLITEVLDELGYAFDQATDGLAALPILQSPRRIDLLVTDVGLPGMNGRQLADVACQLRPGLKVLFVTGYTEHATRRQDFLEPNMDMILKPFAIEALADKIRTLIERR